MGIALFMEHAMGLEPCPLCILQRVTVIVTGLVTLVAALHHPGVRGIRVYAIGAILAAVLGAALAIRQLWLQSLPKDQVPACGPGLDYLLEVLPLTEVLNMILTGDGSCAEIAWTLFGISIPGWTLVGFIGLIAINVFQIVRPKI
jgi:disulfide bond formation protein DsbB|tara:strand:- start:456 stop:890 length:435 start_codon:yes stop_codon:yes gene_type:complete